MRPFALAAIVVLVTGVGCRHGDARTTVAAIASVSPAPAATPTATATPTTGYNSASDYQAFRDCNFRQVSISNSSQSPKQSRDNVIAQSHAANAKDVKGVLFGLISEVANMEQTPGPSSSYNFKDKQAWVVVFLGTVEPIGPPGSSASSSPELLLDVVDDSTGQSVMGGNCHQ